MAGPPGPSTRSTPVKRGRRIALPTIVIVAGALALGLEAIGDLSGVTRFEDFTLDYRQTTTGESFQTEVGERESEITLVLFDDYTVLDSIDGWDWISPFPRDHIAEVIDALAAAGARTIGLDVFLDRLYPNLGTGDEDLRRAIANAGNVVLVAPLARTDSGAAVAPPHRYFAEVSAGVGVADLPASYETFRSAALAARAGDRLVPSFSLSLYAHGRGLDVDSLLAASRETGRIDVAGLHEGLGVVDDRWWEQATADALVPLRIRFVGPPSSTDAADQAGTFVAYPSETTPDLAPFFPESFQDKIVLIGTGFHPEDRFRTPFFGFTPPADESLPDPEPYTWMYGVEVHAHALQNMLDEEYVRPLSVWAKLLMLLLAGLATAAATFRRGAWWGAAAVAGCIVAVAVAAAWSWAGEVFVAGATIAPLGDRFLWVPVTPLMLGAMLSYVGAVGYVSIVEGREKRYIRGAFSKYLAPEVVARIAENPDALRLGGEKRELSFLFSDLAGFTSISESREAEDVIQTLNVYLDDMTQIVRDERGTLDKYIGDAIMAFWNAPEDYPDHRDRALRSAIRMQRRMAELNAQWAKERPDHETLRTRIGVHSGEVVVGNIGGSVFDYTAIGDAVNLAARLEPANKDYDTLTMVSAATLKGARDRYRVRELDLIAVAGREESVQVFELLAEDGVPLAYAKERALERYAEGMEAYRRRAWAEARDHFVAALEEDPTDGPSRVYAERCALHAEEPPPADWDFVVRLEKK